MKFKLVESIDDRLVEYKKIEFTDEQKRDIIDMYASQRLSLADIAAKYKVNPGTIRSELTHNGIQMRNTAKKYPVYLNTISYIRPVVDCAQLAKSILLEYEPSIKLGDYTLSEIYQIRENLRKRMTTNKERVNGSEALAFYMKLSQEGNKEENIKQLINDILNIDHNVSTDVSLNTLKTFRLLTVDYEGTTKDNDLVKFYSFEDKVKVWLNKISSRVKEWGEIKTDSGKYLKALALQYYSPTSGNKDYTKVMEKYDLKSIVYSLFDRYGNRIDPANYKNKINEIPYEDEFNISSLEDLKKYFRDYKMSRDVLYGYTDKKYRVVYVGITQNPANRGRSYAKSDQEKRAIAKALTANLINKLVIFKSYLPTIYNESSSKLLRQLETEFAEKIFNTYYPENRNKSFEELIEAGTLNIDEPGKNQSSYTVNSIQNYVAELATNSLLSKSEYEEKIRSTFGADVAGEIGDSKYSYLNFYLDEYIKNHENSWKYDFLVNPIGHGKSKYLYPELTLNELNELISEARLPREVRHYIRRSWKEAHNGNITAQGKKRAVHNKNNQDNTDDLDDNINGDNYK